VKSPFLRRYGKIIMTFLGIVLMIVFVLPTFNQQRDNSGDTVGKLNGARVRNLDVQSAAGELQLIRALHRDIFLMDLDLDERHPPVHWMLLVKEAEKYGFGNIAPTYAEIEQSLGQGYPPYIPGISPSELQATLRAMHAGENDLIVTFAHLSMIQQLRAFALNLPQPVAAVELLADQELTKVKVAYATFDATKDIKDASAPGPEAMQKQFDLYKGVVRTPIPTNPNTPLPPLPKEINGHHFPFGYKYPDRVKIEYLKFDYAKLRERMKPTQEDYDEAFRYYKENPKEFRNEGQAAGTLMTQPATKSFDEVKNSLVDRQIDLRIRKLVDRMVDRVLAQVGDPWKKGEVDDKGFIKTLPQEKWVSYARLAEDISKNRDFLGYQPEYQAPTAQWLDLDALENLPGIGGAVYSPSDRTVELTFPALATHVRELKEVSPREPLGRLTLQKGVEGPRLRDKQNNVYIYRVVDAAPSAEPKSLDEVRPQVEADLKVLASYGRQQAAARDLAAAAAKGDLVAQAAARSVPVETTAEFSRLDTELPAAVQHITGFVDAAYKLVPGNASAASQPASTQPTGTGATSTLDNDNTLRVYALQLKGVTPAKATDFALRRGELMRHADPALMNFAQKWFTLDALATRLKYEPIVPFSTKKDEG
jgi:hypothetical protein